MSLSTSGFCNSSSRPPTIPMSSRGDFARGVRVGPGARLPRLPTLCARKRKWKLREQNNPDDWQEDLAGRRGSSSEIQRTRSTLEVPRSGCGVFGWDPRKQEDASAGPRTVAHSCRREKVHARKSLLRRENLCTHGRHQGSASPSSHCASRLEVLGVPSLTRVYINTVGTFGIASASYWWSRVATALGRLTQDVPGKAATTWHLLVADDFHLEAGRF